MLGGLFSLAASLYHATGAAYRAVAWGLSGFSLASAWMHDQDLRLERSRIAMRENRKRARVAWRKAGRSWSRFEREFWGSIGGFFHNMRVGASHSWQALRGVPRSQWVPQPEPLNWRSVFNPLGIGFSVGFMMLAGHAAARRAEMEGKNPRVAAATGALTSGLTMLAQQVVFGSTLAGGVMAFGAYLGFYSGRELITGMKHGMRYRESYVRATAAPWSYSSEPSDVAYQMMLMATRNALGYETAFGMEAAPMAARYSR